MGILREIFQMLLEFMDFRRDPEGHQARVLQRLERIKAQEKEAFRERFGSLDLETKSPDQVRRFSTLEEAIHFIANCLEKDAPSKLTAEIELMQSKVAHDSDYGHYFIKGIFLVLQKLHAERDLRTAEVAEDKETYKLHFSDYWLMGLNVDLIKRSEGWVLRDMYLTRG
jgi:hypothetical protein